MNFINKNEKNNKNLYIWCVCVHVCVCVWVCVRVSVRVCVRVVCVHVFAFKIDVKVFQKQSWQIKPSSSKMQFSSPQRSWNHAGTKVITAHPVLSGLWVTGVAVEGMINLALFQLLLGGLVFDQKRGLCQWYLHWYVFAEWLVGYSKLSQESVHLPLGLSQLSPYIPPMLLSSSPLPTDCIFCPIPGGHPFYLLYVPFWPSSLLSDPFCFSCCL